MLGLHCCSVFSLVAVRMGYSLLLRAGFSLQWLPLLQSMGSRAQVPSLWHMGLFALWHVGSSQIRDRTCVSCIGRQILYHRAAGEAQLVFITHFYFCFYHLYMHLPLLLHCIFLRNHHSFATSHSVF